MTQQVAAIPHPDSSMEKVAERVHLYLETLGLPRQIRETLTEQAMAVTLGKTDMAASDMTQVLREVLKITYDALMGCCPINGLEERIWTAARALSGVAADQELAVHVLPPLTPGHMAPHW